jgi:hypothetical protein
MTINDRDRFARRIFLSFIIVCGVVPALLVLICWQHFVAQQSASDKDLAAAEIRRHLLRLEREGDDQMHLQSRLNFFYGNLAEDEFTPSQIAKSVARFREEVAAFVKFRFFGKNGNFIPVSGLSDTRRAVLQKIYSALLLQETAGDSSLLVRDRPFFDAFVGGMTPAEIAQQKSSLIRVMMNGKPGYFYWNVFYDPVSGNVKGGFIAWFKEVDLPVGMAMEQLLASLNVEWRGQRLYGLIDLAVPEKSLVSSDDLKKYAISEPEMSRHLQLLRNRFDSESEIAGNILFTEFFTADRILFCLQRAPELSYQNLTALLKILALIWLLMAIRSGNTFVAGIETEYCFARRVAICFGLSRRQLLAFFAAATALSVTAFIGTHYRDAYLQMQVQKAFSKLSGRLKHIDENYQVAVRNLEKIYRQVVRLPALRNLNQKELNEVARELTRKDAISRLYIADRSGRTRYRWPSEKNSDDIVSRIIPAISRRIFITQRGDEVSLQDRVSEMMMESFSDRLSDMLGDSGASLLRTFENLDRVNEFWLANRRHYVFTSFVERGASQDPWLLYIWHETESFAQRYLQRQIQRNVDEQNALGTDIHLAMVPRNRSRLPFPRDFNKYPFVSQMSEQVAGSELQQSLIAAMAGERWLVAAAPLKSVPDYLLFAAMPYRLVERKTSQLEALLFLIVALGLVSAISLVASIDYL